MQNLEGQKEYYGIFRSRLFAFWQEPHIVFGLADYVTEMYLSACRMCNTITSPHSTNQLSVVDVGLAFTFKNRTVCYRKLCVASPLRNYWCMMP